MPGYRMVQRMARDAAAERRELVAGLLAPNASIAPKYLYDPLGCALFAAICELPEYYPTRTERAIFAAHREDFARMLGRGKQFVDLGAGDCAKARAWLPLLRPSRYVAVDFAGAELAAALARMAADFPDIAMLGVVTDLTQRLDLGADLTHDPVTFFFPGSSIGNFPPADARAFLAGVHRHCVAREGSGLLIGVDTKKDPARLVAAYDDEVGVTAAFDRNVLNHVNRLLGSDFRPGAFEHRASYDAASGRIAMHLVAGTAQAVRLPGTLRTFAPGERIHTEDSYKYSPAEFTAMLQGAGFRSVRCRQDADGDFAVFYAS